jgi:hypothetical protein
LASGVALLGKDRQPPDIETRLSNIESTKIWELLLKEYRVNTFRRGDVYEDRLVHIIGKKIHNKDYRIAVHKIALASHTVCRYEFEGENYSAIAKFYAEPTGWKKNYDAENSMKREFENLQLVEKVIDIPRPLAVKKRFSCAVVTEYIPGEPLYMDIKSEMGLYDRLTAIARLLRKLHDGTQSHYPKEGDFYKFHQTLDQLHLNHEQREIFNQLLGAWWHSKLLERSTGCMIHHDANPVNYVFLKRKSMLWISKVPDSMPTQYMI